MWKLHFVWMIPIDRDTANWRSMPLCPSQNLLWRVTEKAVEGDGALSRTGDYFISCITSRDAYHIPWPTEGAEGKPVSHLSSSEVAVCIPFRLGSSLSAACKVSARRIYCLANCPLEGQESGNKLQVCPKASFPITTAGCWSLSPYQHCAVNVCAFLRITGSCEWLNFLE